MADLRADLRLGASARLSAFCNLGAPVRGARRETAGFGMMAALMPGLITASLKILPCLLRGIVRTEARDGRTERRRGGICLAVVVFFFVPTAFVATHEPCVPYPDYPRPQR